MKNHDIDADAKAKKSDIDADMKAKKPELDADAKGKGFHFPKFGGGAKPDTVVLVVCFISK